MGRKKEHKSKNGTTTMTYVNNANDVTLVPVDSMDNIKEEDDENDSEDRKCRLCSKVLKNKYALKAHMIVHADKNVKCDICGMMFATPAALSRHEKCKHMDINLRPFPCSQCDLRFLNKSHLATHLKTHTGERDVTCGLCFASFYSKADLVRHMKGRHLNIRSFTCHICNKGFFRKSYLKVHLLNIHMQPSDVELGRAQRCYACRYCKKIFLSRTTCYSHERTHNGGVEQRSLCTTCGKTFSRPSSLKKHMEKHGGSPKYKCQYCERPFFHSSSYKRHLNIHNRPDPDVCQICGTLFTNRDAFRRHLRKHVARGEMDSLPQARDDTKIFKVQELLSRGEELDAIIKICNMELVQMGSKRDNQLQQNKNVDVNNVNSEEEKQKWIVQVDAAQGTIKCSTSGDDFEIKGEAFDDFLDSSIDLFSIEGLGYQNNKYYKVVSNDFQSTAKDGVLNFQFNTKYLPGVSSYSYTKPLSIYSSKSHNVSSVEDVSRPSSPNFDEQTQFLSISTDVRFPNHAKTKYGYNVGTAMLEMYELCDNVIICEKYIEPVDVNRDIFSISRTLERNLNEIVFEPIQIVPRKKRSYFNKAFEIYETNRYSGTLALGLDYLTEHQFQQNEQYLDLRSEKYTKFSMFRTINNNEKLKERVFAAEELEEEIDFLYSGKSTSIRLRSMGNLVENISYNSEGHNLDSFEAADKSNGSVDSPEAMDYDDNYDYEVDDVPMSDDEMKEEKPAVQQLDEEFSFEPNQTPIKVEDIKEEDYEENPRKKKKLTKKKKKKRKLKKKLKTKDKSSSKKKSKVKVKKKKKKVKPVVTSDSEYEVKEKWVRPKSLICTEFICYYCDKQCSTKGTLKTHIATMHMFKRVCSCDTCGMSFISKSRLETHIENVHLRIRRYYCTKCEWAFYSKSDLDRHERRHTGVKPFMCHLCSKTFVRKAQLKSHLAIHSGERKFMCNHCGKSFVTRSTLVTHLKRHNTNPHVRFYKVGGSKREKGPPLVCPTCGKILSTAHSLKRHIESVHERKGKVQAPPKAFPCPSCPASFGYKTSMQRHMHKFHKRYKEPRLNPCPICNRMLLHEVSVLKHMIKRHPYNCDDIEAMTAAVNKASQRSIPCPLCNRKFHRHTGLQAHLVKKHYYTAQTYETLEEQLDPRLQPPNTDIYVNTEDTSKPNLLLL